MVVPNNLDYKALEAPTKELGRAERFFKGRVYKMAQALPDVQITVSVWYSGVKTMRFNLFMDYSAAPDFNPHEGTVVGAEATWAAPALCYANYEGTWIVHTDGTVYDSRLLQERKQDEPPFK